MRILIADDEPHVIRVLRMALERAGYTVDSAPNGQAALEQIRAGHPDVLVTDIQMPVMSGRELCQCIQEEMPEREFLIFVVTSRTDVEHREWSCAISNLRLLEKPVSVRKLVGMIEEFVQSQPERGERQVDL